MPLLPLSFLGRTALRRTDWLLLGITVGLALVTLHTVVAHCGGIALPLDDAYIHFTYARSFSQLEPFVYSAGSPPSSGATSLLWPAVLAPVHALFGTGSALSWAAVCLGFISLWGLSCETHRLAAYFIDPALARWLGLLPLAFGAHTWFAASGMEVVPFAWLLCHTSRKTLAFQAQPVATLAATQWLLVLAALCPLLRPEGAVMSVWVAGTFLYKSRRTLLGHGVLALSCAVLPNSVTALFTGEFTPNTALAKWWPLSPYHAAQTPELMWGNLELFFGTLMDGRGWSPMFLPTGIAPITWLCIAAVATCLFSPRTRYPALALLWLACGVLLPTSYETFLVNRLRYIWPFITPWLIGFGIVAAALTAPWRRSFPRTSKTTAIALVIGAGLGLGSKLPATFDDLKESAQAINGQQVWLARWVQQNLPEEAVVGLNDAGALGYLSGRRTFDLVGLTTAGEAKHWRAGGGSRFEHYERLDPATLPTHFVVYPEWLQADLLLGPLLTEREVDATILGGRVMRVHAANYAALRTAESPTHLLERERIVDSLDVADLLSESQHDYALFTSAAEYNQIFTNQGRADGGRSHRLAEEFSLLLGGDCALIMRLYCDTDVFLSVQVGAAVPLHLHAPRSPSWSEHRVAIPSQQCGQRQPIKVVSEDAVPFATLHYWSVQGTPKPTP